MRTLIAEDEKISREVLAAFLAPCGPVDVVVDGAEALDAFRRSWSRGRPYDLICLDIMMPKMDGHAVLRAIRREEAQRGAAELGSAKVIMTTALMDDENRNRAVKGGCKAYLQKPIDRRELLHRVRDLGIFEEKRADAGKPG